MSHLTEKPQHVIKHVTIDTKINRQWSGGTTPTVVKCIL